MLLLPMKCIEVVHKNGGDGLWKWRTFFTFRGKNVLFAHSLGESWARLKL